MAAELPHSLRSRLEALAEGRSGRVLSERSAAISEHYRAFRPSSGQIAAGDDALAYAMSRMPATYAAVLSALDAADARLVDFSPRTLFDAGAGPGTASWAALSQWPDIGAVTMMDHSPDFLKLARGLMPEAEVLRSDLLGAPLGERTFDLVTAGYVLTELADERLQAAVEALWARAEGLLVIVEPGRPRDYERLMRVRDLLIAAGGQVVAPCPHEKACPLPEGDWCHFSVRLQRSREHMRMKGAVLPYEDEKFSYLAVARPGIALHPAQSRIIAPAERSKFAIELPLCTENGLQRLSIAKRDPERFRIARKLDWGDVWPD
jgi:ribosomal protein RSM22 (predicted rRNA methylase)